MHRFRLLLAAAILLAVSAGTTVVVARTGSPLPRSVRAERHHATLPAAYAKARDQALDALFAGRAAAVLHHDKAAFLAGVDPTRTAFRAHQAAVFDALGLLSFAAFRYEVRHDDAYPPSSVDLKAYRKVDDLWLPVLVLRYQLRGFDTGPIDRRMAYTLVRRGTRWYVASDTDLDATTTTSDTSPRQDPWEYPPIVVRQTAHALVIGHDAAAVARVTPLIEGAARRVATIVRTGWTRRTVVVLPKTADETAETLGQPDVPYAFAAVAQPAYPLRPDLTGRTGPLSGTRVVVNATYDTKDPLVAATFRHEITHVALMRSADETLPKWLVEGTAEYVAYVGAAIDPAQAAGDFADLVHRSGVPDYLPVDADFGFTSAAGVGYGSSWLLCRYLAERSDAATLLRFYRYISALPGQVLSPDMLDEALRRYFHVDQVALLRGWRPYVRGLLGDLRRALASPGQPYVEEGRYELDPPSFAKYAFDTALLARNGVTRGAMGYWTVGPVRTATRTVFEVVFAASSPAAATRLARSLSVGGGRVVRTAGPFVVQVDASGGAAGSLAARMAAALA